MVRFQNVDLFFEFLFFLHQFHFRLSKTNDLGFQGLDIILCSLTMGTKSCISSRLKVQAKRCEGMSETCLQQWDANVGIK